MVVETDLNRYRTTVTRKLFVAMLLGALAGLGVAPSASRAATLPSEVFILGDSLSDVGNAASLADFALGQPFYPDATVGFCNPVDVFLLGRDCDSVIYRKSRASNGPVAVEALAPGLGLPPLEPSFHVLPERPVHGTDYAVAGGTARGTSVDDLAAQVDALRLDRAPELPADALYVLILGGNDGLDAVRSAAEESVGDVPAEGSAAIVDAAVAAIGNAVDVLVGSGARRLIVANLPNLAAVPAVRERASSLGLDEAAAAELATGITATFNDALAARLADAAAAHPEARIQPFDLYSVLEEARVAAAAAGEDVMDACFDSEAYRESASGERDFNPGCAPQTPDAAPSFDRFFFWDSVHPTGNVHAAIGQALLELALTTLDDSAAPGAAPPVPAATPPAPGDAPPASTAAPPTAAPPGSAAAAALADCYASLACVLGSLLFGSD